MLGIWLNNAYIRTITCIQNAIRKENGDTNFISILIILGIVIVVAGVFIGFKDQIVNMVSNIVGGFTISTTTPTSGP